MTEKAEKNKSGAGKFFLGAAIGAAIGAIASKFIDINVSSDDGEPVEDEKPEIEGPKDEHPKEKKKPATKKSSEKK